MIKTGKLAGCTLFITGASRGIGKAIALKAARDGANIVIAAKTTEPHPKLPGTIYTAAKEVEEVGGKCLPCIVDVRDEVQIQNAVESAVAKFGGIDVVVNNASAINLSRTLDTPMKRYDLMNNINTRGTYLVSKLCIPHLKRSSNPHILNLSPPLIMQPRWFKDHVAYTIAKYGMSMCVLGMAEEFRDDGIAVNALWPKTTITTAAMEMLGSKDVLNYCRKPEIVADAAYVILSKDSRTFTGNFCLDEDILRDAGIIDFDQYAVQPGSQPLPDLFLSEEDLQTFSNASFDLPSHLKFTKSAESEDLTIDTLLDKIKKIVSTNTLKEIGGVYQFQIKGEMQEEQVWFIDTSTDPPSVGKGTPPSGRANVTFSSDIDNFIKLFTGKLKPTTAFMSGKLKIKGDMKEALKLDKIMSEVRSKL